MQVVSFENGSLVFNWQQLPNKVRSNLELRDKIFRELQNKYKVGEFVDSKTVFEINKYVIDRIKTEIKI